MDVYKHCQKYLEFLCHDHKQKKDEKEKNVKKMQKDNGKQIL
jgi:hypothetical protein